MKTTGQNGSLRLSDGQSAKILAIGIRLKGRDIWHAPQPQSLQSHTVSGARSQNLKDATHIFTPSYYISTVVHSIMKTSRP